MDTCRIELSLSAAPEDTGAEFTGSPIFRCSVIGMYTYIPTVLTKYSIVNGGI